MDKTYAVGGRYWDTLCDQAFDFRVAPWDLDRTSGIAFWTVDLALRETCGPVLGNRVRTRLLDAAGRDLECLTPVVEHATLSETVWQGSRAAHQASVFRQAKASPAFLLVRIDDREALYPLGPPCDSTTKARPKEEFIAWRGPPEDQCCPETFTVTPPEGSRPTTVRTTTTELKFWCKPWMIDATFGSESPCVCTCCQYRQYVKGGSAVVVRDVPNRVNVSSVNQSPITDFTPAAGAGAPRPVQGISADEFGEDTQGDPNHPGRPRRYGHRGEMGSPPFDDGSQDYPTECSYWAMDAPEIVLSRPSLTGLKASVATMAADAGRPATDFEIVLVINFEFRGVILDTCRGEEVRVKTWSWEHVTTL